jgi:hypothetical protein
MIDTWAVIIAEDPLLLGATKQFGELGLDDMERLTQISMEHDWVYAIGWGAGYSRALANILKEES